MHAFYNSCTLWSHWFVCHGWYGVQETLRTSAFPSSHVKEKWAKNLYIAGIAYGRTVS